MLDQVEQQLSAEDEAVRTFKIGAHAIGVDEQSVDEVRGLAQEIIDERGRIREDDAFGTEECEMSRSCQRATFSSPAWALLRTGVRATDLFGGHGIALVRHGG
jgi:hypothetical protein